MKIAGRKIGPEYPPYIIAEASCNHCGSLDSAIALIAAAKDAGADAIKFQCYEPTTITLDCDKDDFLIKSGPWAGQNLHELYTKTHTPFEWFPALFAYARAIGITPFASVFDKTSVDLLVTLQCPCFKIASMEIVDLSLIRYAAKTGKPLLISTGMASKEEIISAACEAPDHIMLHCVSGYPTKIENSDLSKFLYARTHPIGLSDHSQGVYVPIAATAMGACVIEKHLMLGKKHTEDFEFSLPPKQFREMVNAVHEIWQAMQPPAKTAQESSRQFRRSLYVIKDIKKGEVFTEDNVRSIRPGYGLDPAELPNVLGKCASKNITRGSRMEKSLCV